MIVELAGVEAADGVSDDEERTEELEEEVALLSGTEEEVRALLEDEEIEL